MNIESQVCSLELSKKLKELGVKQESLFYIFYNGDHEYLFCKYYEQYSHQVDLNINDGYSAFTASELLEMLPSYVGCWLDIIKGRNITDKSDKYSARYYMSDIIMEPEENVCNSLAKMLIHLIEKKLIEV